MIDLMHGVDADLDDLEQYVGWFWQEKYRGVRLYWDGHAAWSRQGIEIALPADWYEFIPKVALDCELYDGPRGERRCTSAVRFGAKHVTKTMRIVAFDCTEHPGDPWVDRMRMAAGAVAAADCDKIERAPWGCVASVEHMLNDLAKVKKRDGEGLILRKPSSTYVAGYSDNIIKLKHGA